MPANERFKTKYPGVTFIIGNSLNGKSEKIYYIRYRKKNKQIEEKAGRQYQDDMTPAKASALRNIRIQGKEQTNAEQRTAEETRKDAEKGRYTIGRLWNEYSKNRAPGRALTTDKNRYENHLEKDFAKKEPKDIIKLDVDRLRLELAKKLSPQTVKHVLNLLTWIINYGVKNGLCRGLPFHIQKPTVNNVKTEDLSPEQVNALLQAIDGSQHKTVAAMMKMALYSGMRRGEMLKLQWPDVDLERGFVHLREPKGGPDQRIPINNLARDLLESLPRTSNYVFPGRSGRKRSNTSKAACEIRDTASLPKTFRPLHGLRHVYASMLASSGKVDMYVLQRLLTHKSPVMTQRYAHLRDETLKAGAGQVDDIFKKQKEDAEEKQKQGQAKVVNLKS
ncbi:MAG: site-specific integrase [Desulfobacteraceae bacterium]|nr:site-specific integrase [Desulfobacteraceae bacterium]